MAASGLLAVQSAFAADMPAKMYTKAPMAAPAYSWSGFYIGVNAGGYWAKDDDPAFVSANNNFGAAGVASINQLSPVTLSPSGFTGGLQIGYNWQLSALVFGVEGDFEGMTGSSSRTLNVLLAGVAPSLFTDSAKENWMASVRARAGFTFNQFLIYATGGPAWSNWHTNHTFADIPGGINGVIDSTFTRSGWVIGGGAEYAVTGNWIARVEYLHADFGTRTSTEITTVPAPGFFTNIDHPERLRTDIVRAGISYKFGGM